MNIQRKFERPFYFLAVSITAFTSCKKDNSLSSSSSSTSATIAVAASLSASVATTSADSIYLLQPCAHGSTRDSIAEASLPAAVTSYLQANYSGYTFSKTFAIVNSSGTTTGYVAVVYYNNKPVGLQFDSSGNFVKTLEQREKGDLDGDGWHHGGRFEDREGSWKDTIALTSLPSAVLSYLNSNYGVDTLVKAFKNKDTSYLVISRNNGVYATLFDA